MKHSWSSEVFEPAADAVLDCAGKVGNFLSIELSTGVLSDLSVEVRYIPIVMPQEWHKKYKERSRARLKERIYDCAPHLDYDIFVNGSEDDQIKEYIRGLAKTVVHLPKFGATEEQVAAFRQAMLAAGG